MISTVKLDLWVSNISRASSVDVIKSPSITIAIPSIEASSSSVVISLGLNRPKYFLETTQKIHPKTKNVHI